MPAFLHSGRNQHRAAFSIMETIRALQPQWRPGRIFECFVSSDKISIFNKQPEKILRLTFHTTKPRWRCLARNVCYDGRLVSASLVLVLELYIFYMNSIPVQLLKRILPKTFSPIVHCIRAPSARYDHMVATYQRIQPHTPGYPPTPFTRVKAGTHQPLSIMAPPTLSCRSSNKDFGWQQDLAEDLFNSIINPDSFHLANNEDERAYPNELINLFDVQASSSGSDTIDTSPMPDLDANHIQQLGNEASWHAALSFAAENAASPTTIFKKSSRQCSIYTQACGRSAASETDLFSPQRPGTPIPHLKQSDPVGAPSWSIKDKKLFATPLVVRRKPQPPSACIQKPKRRGSASPKMMSSRRYKPSPRQESWTESPQSPTNSDTMNFRMPFTQGGLLSTTSSTQLKTNDIEYDFDLPIRSPDVFAEDIEALSPLSNSGYSFFQSANNPTTSPHTFANGLGSPKSSFAEPQPSHVSSYRPTPYPAQSKLESFLTTPPLTQPMTSTQWAHDLPASSTNYASSDKAEQWWRPTMQQADPSEVTCGAPAAPGMQGLGISGISGANMTSIASNGRGIIQPAAVSLGAATTIATHPTPSTFSSRQTPFSASASPNPAAPAAMYPLSPLQSHAQVRQSQHMQHQPNMYRHHQRHHTAHSTSSTSPSANSLPPQLSNRTPSASPPPPAKQSAHRRTKSSHHTRHKSGVVPPSNSMGSRHAPVGFVNFTPDDSRKILTGVAPSGSSKTKARREKEAADKRRKLSEAAKRAILEAGGDLRTLEREGLLVLESAL
jgi:hypothetical protein